MTTAQCYTDTSNVTQIQALLHRFKHCYTDTSNVTQIQSIVTQIQAMLYRCMQCYTDTSICYTDVYKHLLHRFKQCYTDTSNVTQIKSSLQFLEQCHAQLYIYILSICNVTHICILHRHKPYCTSKVKYVYMLLCSADISNVLV